MLSDRQLRSYQAAGYIVVPRLFDRQEVAALREHFMRLRHAGAYPGDLAGVDIGSADPLKRYPRMINMHRWDSLSLRWMLDPRLYAVMTALMGKEPFAVQTMLYFKPPGARGQAMHQDQHYLKVQPGTCMAAWLALDRSDEENGCMRVVLGSHTLPVLCTMKADTAQSFTDVTVPLPSGIPIRPLIMDEGDVLFFNGQLIHGSLPNQTPGRFRRALIGHYIAGEAEKVAGFYNPILRKDGTAVQLGHNPGGGPCGTWVERDGRPVVEVAGAGEAHDLHE